MGEIAKSRALSLIETNPHCLHRACVPGHLMEKICWTEGWQFGPKIKKLNHWLWSDVHADGIGYLLDAALIEASEKIVLQPRISQWRSECEI